MNQGEEARKQHFAMVSAQTYLSDKVIVCDPEVYREVNPISAMLLLVLVFIQSNKIQTGSGLRPLFRVMQPRFIYHALKS